MKSILKQSSYLMLAQLSTRVIGFFYTIFLANSLGVLNFGLYSVGLAYFSIISSLADFGFNRFLIREIAKDREKQWELVWNLIMIRLTMICVFFAIFSIGLYMFDSDKIRVSIILLASLAVLPQAIAVTFDGIFIALRKLQFSALASFIGFVAIAFLGFILVSSGFGVFGAINAILFGQFILAAILIILLYRIGGLKVSEIKSSVIKKALIGSLPYGLLAILGLLYFRIDIVLLSYMKGNFETGIYSIAYRFLEAVILIPGAFAVALFPALAKLHDESLRDLKKLYFKSLKLMAILGITIMVGYIFVLPLVIKLFLPNYLQATKVIQILSLSIPFIFMATPGVQVMLSTEKYLKQVIILSVFTVTFNVVLNLLFIPKFSFLAAAWITVLSEILSFTIFFLFIKQKILDTK